MIIDHLSKPFIHFYTQKNTINSMSFYENALQFLFPNVAKKIYIRYPLK